MYRYQGMDGIKTGYTEGPRHNLVRRVSDGNPASSAVCSAGEARESRDEKMAALLDQHLGRVSSPGRPMIAAARHPAWPTWRAYLAFPCPSCEVPSPGRSCRRIADGSYRPADGQPQWRGPRTRNHRRAAGEFTDFLRTDRGRRAQDARRGTIGWRAALLVRAPHTEAAGSAELSRRFVGFASREAATTACSILKKRSYDCVLLPDGG